MMKRLIGILVFIMATALTNVVIPCDQVPCPHKSPQPPKQKQWQQKKWQTKTEKTTVNVPVSVKTGDNNASAYTGPISVKGGDNTSTAYTGPISVKGGDTNAAAYNGDQIVNMAPISLKSGDQINKVEGAGIENVGNVNMKYEEAFNPIPLPLIFFGPPPAGLADRFQVLKRPQKYQGAKNGKIVNIVPDVYPLLDLEPGYAMMDTGHSLVLLKHIGYKSVDPKSDGLFIPGRNPEESLALLVQRIDEETKGQREFMALASEKYEVQNTSKTAGLPVSVGGEHVTGGVGLGKNVSTEKRFVGFDIHPYLILGVVPKPPKTEPKKEEAPSPPPPKVEAAPPPPKVEAAPPPKEEKAPPIPEDPFRLLGESLTSVHFELNSAVIKDFTVAGVKFDNTKALREAKFKLNSLKPLFKKYPNFKVLVVGYTSDEGPQGKFRTKTKEGDQFTNSMVYNMALGQRRTELEEQKNKIEEIIVAEIPELKGRFHASSSGWMENEKFKFNLEQFKAKLSNKDFDELYRILQRRADIWIGFPVSEAMFISKPVTK